jgi:hypothetical protein
LSGVAQASRVKGPWRAFSLSNRSCGVAHSHVLEEKWTDNLCLAGGRGCRWRLRQAAMRHAVEQ